MSPRVHSRGPRPPPRPPAFEVLLLQPPRCLFTPPGRHKAGATGSHRHTGPSLLRLCHGPRPHAARHRRAAGLGRPSGPPGLQQQLPRGIARLVRPRVPLRRPGTLPRARRAPAAGQEGRAGRRGGGGAPAERQRAGEAADAAAGAGPAAAAALPAPRAGTRRAHPHQDRDPAPRHPLHRAPLRPAGARPGGAGPPTLSPVPPGPGVLPGHGPPGCFAARCRGLGVTSRGGDPSGAARGSRHGELGVTSLQPCCGHCPRAAWGSGDGVRHLGVTPLHPCCSDPPRCTWGSEHRDGDLGVSLLHPCNRDPSRGAWGFQHPDGDLGATPLRARSGDLLRSEQGCHLHCVPLADPSPLCRGCGPPGSPW